MNSLTGKSTGIALLMAAALIAALFAMGAFSAGSVGAQTAPTATAALVDATPATPLDQDDDKLVIEVTGLKAVGVANDGSTALRITMSEDLGSDVAANADTLDVLWGDDDDDQVPFQLTVADGAAYIDAVPANPPAPAVPAHYIFAFNGGDIEGGSATITIGLGQGARVDTNTIITALTIGNATAATRNDVEVGNDGKITGAPDGPVLSLSRTRTDLLTAAEATSPAADVSVTLTLANFNNTASGGQITFNQTPSNTFTTGFPNTIQPSDFATALVNGGADFEMTLPGTALDTEGPITITATQDSDVVSVIFRVDTPPPAKPIKLSSDTAGDAVQVAITATAIAPIDSGTDIVIDLKTFGVPSTIAESSINLNSAGADPYVGEPNSVTVAGTKITLALHARFPGATGRAGNISGEYTITIKQSAGVTNPATAGKKTVTVKDADGTKDFNPVIKSKVKLSATAGARGTGVAVSAVGIGKGGATVYLVKGCPDQQTDDKGVKNCNQDNDISLGNAESSGGKISVDIDTSSSDFEPGVTQVDKDGNAVGARRPYKTTDALRGLNRIAIVDGTGRTTDKDAYFQVTPTIETDEVSGKQGDEITILVEDWYYGTGANRGVVKVTVGDEEATFDGPGAIDIDEDGDGEIDILLPNAARLGEQQLKVVGNTLNRQGSLTAGGGKGTADAATGTVIVDALDIELDPDTVVLGQQFTVKVKGFSDENPTADANGVVPPEIQYVTVGDIEVVETTGGVTVPALTIDTNGDFTNTFVVKSTYVDPQNQVAENELDPGTYRVEVKDWTGRIAIGHLTFPEPEITIDPPVGRRGTTVSIVGKNFPAGRVVEIFYDEDEDDDLLTAILADSAGRFRSSFTVPSNAEIGEEQDILAISAANPNKYKTKAVHALPPQELIITPESASAGGRITIEGHNMPLFTLVRLLIADINVSGQGVETDGLGSFTIEDVLVPQLRPGSHTVEAQVQTQGEEAAKVRKVIQIVDIITRDSEEAFSDLIENGTLTRVWHLDAATQTWSFFDPATEFADFNTLTEVSSGQIVTIIMSAQDEFQGETLYVGSNNVAIE